MKKILLAAVLLSVAGTTMAAGKSCDELKYEVDARLKDKGITGFTLEVVDRDSMTQKKVVGTCQAGTKLLVYSRNSD